MHGRIKIKERAEIELEKKRKYQEKAKAFKICLDFCLKSKAENDYNKEAIRRSWDLLASSPDVYSVWNFRKEFIIKARDDYEKQLKELKELRNQVENGPDTIELDVNVDTSRSDMNVDTNRSDMNVDTSRSDMNVDTNRSDMNVDSSRSDMNVDSNRSNANVDSNRSDMNVDSNRSDVNPNSNRLDGDKQDQVSVSISKEDKLKQLDEDERELKSNFQRLCKEELELSEYSLIKNSKSYSAWQHRLFILSVIPEPDFNHEFALNESYLQKDGRNLHCWYYRTSLCNMTNRNLNDEIDFSLAKIEDNLSSFSYSTLYYRSLVLTKASALGLIDFSKKWLDEFELAENAVYTMVNDQAMWLYFRWLLLTNQGTYLGTKEQSNEINLIKIIFNKEVKQLIFYFDKVCKEFPFKSIEATNLSIKRENLKRIDGSLSKLWYIELDSNRLEALRLDDHEYELTNLENYQLWLKANANESKPLSIPDDKLQSLLTLKSLEPDNKWLNLILSYLVETNQHELLNDLIEIDPLRTNYYKDQQTKIKLDKIVEKLDSNQNVLTISQLELTVLYNTDPFAHLTKLVLAGNKISRLSANFNKLISVRELDLDDNRIEKVDKNFKMINLLSLRIQNNKLNSRSGITHLFNCPKLNRVFIYGNTITISDLDRLADEDRRLQSNDIFKLEKV